MSFSGLAEVTLNQRVGPEHYMMRVLAPELTRLCKPGQFVHVRCNNLMDPLLRRPISLHGIDYDKGTVSLLYQVVGRGTQLLAEMLTGAEIDIMGPLGKGFNIPDGIKKVMVVGGGIGAAPLFPLIQALKHYKIEQTVLLGARTAEYIIGANQLASLDIRVETATDDGSLGYKGFVTDLAEKHIKGNKPDYFFACGPNVMLDSLLKITRKHGIDGQVSLEEHMGCGVGACLGCVCKVAASGQRLAASRKETKDKDWEYKLVCTDGPVFEASEVIFDD
jgi:dihydroorotate dehydrogenase electron transfer subunit